MENTKLIGELLGQANDVITELDAIVYSKYSWKTCARGKARATSNMERGPQREKKPTPAPAPSPNP